MWFRFSLFSFSLSVVVLFYYQSSFAEGFDDLKRKLKPGLWNGFWFYNKENGAWEDTSITLTYLENVIQPFFDWRIHESIRFRAGAGFLVGLNQEQKVRNIYPYIQSRFFFNDASLDLGSLDSPHDFPPPVLDPLIQMTPQIRLGRSTQIPIDYETFPVTGPHSHGLYEYGIAYRWGWENGGMNRGELYLNWQLPDTIHHRERFDIGFTKRQWVGGVPFYLAFHYWHNGGQEHFHPVMVTENYVLAVGIRNDTMNLLLLGSLWFPNRDVWHSKVSGTAVYADYRWVAGGFFIQPSFFISDEFRVPKNRFISVEGDPFFRVPLYLGLNVGYIWQFSPATRLDVALVNGLYQNHALRISPSILRYDQMVRFQIHHVFGESADWL